MDVDTVKKGDVRFYYDEADPSTRYPGVTSIVDMTPKKFLQRWNADMAAELALDSIDYVQRMADRDRAGAKRWLSGAAWRHTKRRSDVGNKAHDMFERMIRGQHVGHVHPDMEPYRVHFADFLRVVRPELVRAEDVAWSDTHRYAGSFDAWLRLRVRYGVLEGPWVLDPDNTSGEAHYVHVIADWKTSKSVWPSVALQMGAYAHADKIIDPDGTAEPMPIFDGAVVLHITPNGWSLIPVYTEQLSEAFRHFLHLRQTFTWEHDVSKRVLGKPLAASARLVTGTERRA